MSEVCCPACASRLRLEHGELEVISMTAPRWKRLPAVPPSPGREPPIPERAIQAVERVAEANRVPVAQLLGRDRRRRISRIRYEAMRAAIENGASVLATARLFGRHHSTVQYGLTRHAAVLSE